MANFLSALFGGTKHDKDMKRLRPIVESVKKEYGWAESLKDEDFPRITAEWKEEVKNGKKLDELLPKAFALAREAAGRVLGERHYDVQIMGAIVLHQGSILEMKTGEGKTLTAVPAAYLNALEGKGVHIVTVNDYLAQRDAEWMGRVYSFLGMTTGCIIAGQDEQRKREAYSADVTYGTNNEFGFDYLRDNMKISLKQKLQPKHHYCIVDEIDSILIDEARTPLIISGQAEDDTPKVKAAKAIVPFLKECEKDPETGDYYELTAMEKLDREAYAAFDEKGDFKLDEKSKKVTFTKSGMTHMEELLRKEGALRTSKDEEGNTTTSLYDDENFELVHYVTQAVRAQYLYKRDVDYLVKDGEVQIVDEFTGRVLPGRRYSEGLHQAIEAKENVSVRGQSKTFATITFQNFFRMYDKISGMTGTADTEATEFKQIYGLDVVVIPTNLPVQRKDLPDLTFYDEAMKFRAIVNEVKKIHATGQPVLIGTTSIEKSERLSALLTREGIRHEVLNAKNHAREAYIIGEAGAKGAVTIATNMAGRGTDIKLGGSPLHLAMKKVGTDADPETLKKAMEDIQEDYKKAYEEVRALGGLYIIGSERHESRRIDNQLRGRSGRQGDPGTSQFYIALDDPLMRLFAKEGLKEMIGKLGLKDGEPIHHKILDSAIENAQKRVEERNFQIRKHLLEYDDVLNEQRNFIYNERDRILADEELLGEIIKDTKEYVDEAWEDAAGDKEKFAEDYRSVFAVRPDETIANNPDAIKETMEKNLLEKEAKVGKANFNNFIRFVYLRNIDKRWVDHLDALEDLRDAASLMSYAQKNPLVEYKNTASDAFDEMISSITENVVRTVNAVRITVQPRPQQAPNAKLQATHSAPGAPMVQRSEQKTAVSSQATAHNTTVVRSTPKVGRNDPCPCGSGKKYKNCCGKGV
ncbi:MAG: preprotein translocase subunit SecA [Spirochaetes bacterium]|uniref:Protein translocase subunit SecA n=1 Tax=Candidatus Ornithospirochaeta stercoripullorum TaxID=2840899 RepID=A0A9D9E4K2_9SPIO|nr:preprotein translocase subunit SecA [Candidatus Ornithospirochaeta stercoripullorum]